ncbi:MAG: hypothetical protein PHY08_13625 [Candidatus Cloacimonetes bacterium]|nr:hypothetical protein [Candidatus Cloacimonadota bacterium]
MNYFSFSDEEMKGIDVVKLLDYLCSVCDTIHLIQPHIKADDKNLVKKLKPYIIKSSKTYKWLGEERGKSHPLGPYIENVINLTPKVINEFKKYGVLLKKASGFDIAFYKNEECYMFNVAHENFFALNPNTMADFIDKYKKI